MVCKVDEDLEKKTNKEPSEDLAKSFPENEVQNQLKKKILPKIKVEYVKPMEEFWSISMEDDRDREHQHRPSNDDHNNSHRFFFFLSGGEKNNHRRGGRTEPSPPVHKPGSSQ